MQDMCQKINVVGISSEVVVWAFFFLALAVDGPPIHELLLGVALITLTCKYLIYHIKRLPDIPPKCHPQNYRSEIGTSPVLGFSQLPTPLGWFTAWSAVAG